MQAIIAGTSSTDWKTSQAWEAKLLAATMLANEGTKPKLLGRIGLFFFFPFRYREQFVFLFNSIKIFFFYSQGL